MSIATTALTGRLAFWACAPLMALQGRRTRRHAQRFPAASGEASGTFGSGSPNLVVLGLGDSIVAGVGAGEHHAAMPAQTARRLSELYAAPAAWRAVGEIGARAPEILHQLNVLSPGPATHVVLSVGVNHVTAAHTTARFARELRSLLHAVRECHPHAKIALSGLPPLARFPVLPQPLRRLLGWRSSWFDVVAARVARSVPGVIFVPLDFRFEPGSFSDDGFHPSADSHRAYGEQMAEALARGT